MMYKGGFFDQSYHVPCIVRDPRQSADGARGKQLGALTENVDIMPTLLDALGLHIPEQCDGRSLLPLLARGDDDIAGWREDVFWEYVATPFTLLPSHLRVRAGAHPIIDHDRHCASRRRRYLCTGGTSATLKARCRREHAPTQLRHLACLRICVRSPCFARRRTS